MTFLLTYIPSISLSPSLCRGQNDYHPSMLNTQMYGYGMMWTLMMGGIWQLVACYKGWNVSATHSIIGGIIGFAVAAKGLDGEWVENGRYFCCCFYYYYGGPVVSEWWKWLSYSAHILYKASHRATPIPSSFPLQLP